MVYTPSKPPPVSTADGQALAAYLNDELQTLASGFRSTDITSFSPSYVAPVRPRTGMLLYADGTKWNPGSGEGAYFYTSGGLWVPAFDPADAVAPPLPKGLLFGCTMSTAGSSTTLSVSSGLACDSTGAALMALSAMSKTTGAWVAGTGNGGIDTGAIAASKWYHWYVIENVNSGAVDLIFSLSASAPAYPAGYTLSRRIGAAKTNGSSQWVKFIQLGDEFLWDVVVNDANGVNPGTTGTLYTCTVPTGIQVLVRASVLWFNVSGSNYVQISSPDITAPSVVTASNGATLYSADSTHPSATEIATRSNTSGQIRATSSGAGGSFYINTMGWIDRRGRDA